jgi:hypothetical protein
MPNPWVSLRCDQLIPVNKAMNEKEQLEKPAPIFIGALTPGIKQKATSVRLSNPSYGMLESGKVGRQKKNNWKKCWRRRRKRSVVLG